MIDRVVLILVEAWVYLRHWRQVRRYYRKRARLPRVAHPHTASEKMFWRRVFDRNPLFVTFADKLRMREWMAARAPELKLPVLRFVGAGPRDIPDEALVGGVIVKWNAASGQNVRLEEPPADRAAFDAAFEAWAARPYGRDSGEWSYALAGRRIMVESLLPATPDEPLLDLQFYCCNGEVLFGWVTGGEKRPPTAYGIFEPDGRRRPVEAIVPVLRPGRSWMPAGSRPPPVWPRAVEIARRLSQGIDFVRVDFMLAAGELYAAEMTVFVSGGYGLATVPGFADDWRDRWDLTKSWFMTTPQRGWRRVYARALKRVLKTSSPHSLSTLQGGERVLRSGGAAKEDG